MLQKFLGSTTGEIGFSDLVKKRLSTEIGCLGTEQARICSLVVDEMRIKQRLEYNRQRDIFLGDIDMGLLCQTRIGANWLTHSCVFCSAVFTQGLGSQWDTSLREAALVRYSLKPQNTSSERRKSWNLK